ncbi:MarR family transcriptional regulator [Amycolatopsis sp. A133]|uniref:MarR family transcriptional regulator n=1 Tax=Amycolatopsis sp. A133 TaxID=3064472 RepID=UPI0027FB7C26|nr:MarR family transcriptional regulator [Amycolatopsis sp. A133]MDQ7802704.1 MarR family transcriptional regulator [Amycolatopsis sp. A133]
MTPISPASRTDLDALLLQPVRLFIACLLADTRWRSQLAIQQALGLPTPDLELHIEFLRASGYLRSRAEPRELRLTPLGLNRLMEHVGALKTVAATAAALVAEVRAAHPSESPPSPP